MGYPAQISGADDDPVMQAIRAKFAQQQQPATGMPTNILPEQMRAAAQASVLARNANARPVAVNSQMAAMQSDPAYMEQIMSMYGPDMVAQMGGGGNGTVQQPQNIQRPVAANPQQAYAPPTESIPPLPEAQVATENIASNAGVPADGISEGMDPALAAALGLTGGAAAGGVAGYFAGRGRAPAPAASNGPTMRGAVPGDIDAGMPPPPPPKQPMPAAPPPPAADPKMQAAVMGAAVPPQASKNVASSDSYAQDSIYPMDESDLAMMRAHDALREESGRNFDDPDDEYTKFQEAQSEEGIPEYMRSDVDNRSRSNSKRTQRMASTEDAADAHMRSIIMEGQDARPLPEATAPTQTVEAAPQQQEAPTKRTRKSKAAKDATVVEGEASKKRTRKAKAEPNVDGGTDFVHTDAKVAKEAIKASKEKKAKTLAEKVDDSAAKTAAPVEAEKPKKTRAPRKPKEKAAAPAIEQPKAEDNAPKLIKKTKSRLDTPTGPGAKASKGMSLAEAKTLITQEPDLEVIDKYKVYDMTDAEFKALQEQAKDLIRASKGTKTVSPKAVKRQETIDAVAQEPKERVSYTYDDKDEAILKAIKEPIVTRRPTQRKSLTPAEATARLLAKRAK